MIFLLRKQFFEKIITEGGLEFIVLNPFLDFLCISAFKNIGLAPGIPKTCFQHPQDVVVVLFSLWTSFETIQGRKIIIIILAILTFSVDLFNVMINFRTLKGEKLRVF
jgi:hypothetical protein